MISGGDQAAYLDPIFITRTTCLELCYPCSVLPPPSELRSLTRHFRSNWRRVRRDRMRIWTRWFRAERMILALLGMVGEHTTQLGTRQAELALGMPICTFIPKFARWESTTQNTKEKLIIKQRRDKAPVAPCIYNKGSIYSL